MSTDPSIPAVLVKNMQIDGNPVPDDIVIISGDVAYQASNHDQATISIKTPSVDYTVWNSKTISFLYGPRLLERTFSGYVQTIAPSGSSPMSQGSGGIDISCLGVTYKMRQGRPRYWFNVQVSNAISDIVSGYQLGVLKEPNDAFAWEAHAQTVSSDWSKVIELATFNGYNVYCSEGVVRICDPVRLLNTSGYATELTQMLSATDTTNNMYEWDSQYAVDTTTEPTYYPVFAYLTLSGQVQYSDPLGDGKYLDTDYPVHTVEQAQAMKDGIMRNVANWACTGTARIRGNAQILPGDVVTVRISPVNTAPNKDDGPWLVTAVEHSLDTNSFQTQLILNRRFQFVAEDPSVASWKPYYMGDSRGAPKLMLLQGDWVSTWRETTKP